jgi:ABC-type transport system involved in cytochrome c biogenesis permease subunit
MAQLIRSVPAHVVGTLIAVACLAYTAVPPRDSGAMHLSGFGQLPVLSGGRVKPMDTVARTTLMIVNDRQSFAAEQEAPKRPAIEWLLDVLAKGDGLDNAATKYQTFRIEDDQVLKLLGLPMRPRWWRYSIEEVGPSFNKLEQEARRALKRDQKERDEFDQHVLKLRRHLELFLELNQHHEPRVIPPSTPEGQWQSFARAEAEARDPVIEKAREALRAKGVTLEQMDSAQRAEFVGTIQRQIEESLANTNPAAAAYAQILKYYKDGKTDAFNRALTEYRTKYFDHVRTLDLWRVSAEVHFNSFAPFYQSLVLYVVVALSAAVSWLGFGAPLRRTALWLCLLTFGVHTAGLIARMVIQGRPPVTNLYSSAVFIGWGAVLFGLVLEWLYGHGIGTFVAGALGFATALVAHFLGTDGDTLEMLQAVLDTDFWLATHVTIVNLGYTATLVPGTLGTVYIIAGLFTPALTRDLAKTLGQMIYGTICFATLLSFTGTVLGGLWADYSWGRFWGWDPKENGALLIVIWNALILHARWAGLVKPRGVATLAILGNVVTIWSWFGTNQLGVGLHAYGFRSGMAKWIVISSAAHLAVAGLGLVPLRYWRSNGTTTAAAKPQSRQKGPREKPLPARV